VIEATGHGAFATAVGDGVAVGVSEALAEAVGCVQTFSDEMPGIEHNVEHP